MKKKQPWPTQKAMQQIYDLHLWGGKEHDFYSGEGSHHERYTEPYLKMVSHFLNSQKAPISLCDLGCGDFNIGKELVPFVDEYIGVDIVPNLIERNQQKFKISNVSFECLDIAKDVLPMADVVLIRQVLQHLSNAEILNLIPKLSQYPYIILTEHLPADSFIPNVDIISGQGIRLKKKSGLDLSQPPFDLNYLEKREILKIHTPNHKGVVSTILFTMS